MSSSHEQVMTQELRGTDAGALYPPRELASGLYRGATEVRRAPRTVLGF